MNPDLLASSRWHCGKNEKNKGTKKRRRKTAGLNAVLNVQCPGLQRYIVGEGQFKPIVFAKRLGYKAFKTLCLYLVLIKLMLMLFFST